MTFNHISNSQYRIQSELHDSVYSSQLLFRLNQILNLSETVIVIQAARVKQRATRLDDMTRHYLLDGQLDLFEVDSSLQ